MHSHNVVKNLHGKINDNNEIELTYDTDTTTDNPVTINTNITNPST